MSTEKWKTLNRKELQDLAAKKGITGVTRKSKDELIAALGKLAKAKAKAREKAKARPQLHAAHLTNGAASAEDLSGGPQCPDAAARRRSCRRCLDELLAA